MASYAVEDRSVRAIPANEPEVTGDYAAHVSKTMKLEITHADDETVEFDLSGVDVSFANALRRIMLAEVPTMAIETVYVCLLYTSPSPRDGLLSRMPSSA